MQPVSLAVLAGALSSASTAMAHTGNHALLSNAEQVMHMLLYSLPGLWLFALPLAFYLTTHPTRAAGRNRQPQKDRK